MIELFPFYMLRSAVLTIVFEVIFALLIGVRKKQDVLIVALAQLATNPLVVSVSMTTNLFFGLRGRNLALLFLEPFAVLLEGFIYKKVLGYKRINGWLLSLILNAVSFILGELINYYLL